MDKTSIRCANCGFELQKKIDDWLLGCNSCGLEQSLLFDEKCNGLNPIGWTESASNFLSELREHNANTILKKLANHTNLKSKSLLDIGCAAGWFLKIAESYGIIATGIEPEKNIAKKGQSKGLDIKNISFPDKSLVESKYDVVTFNDVFEHIKDPNEMLLQVREHLSDNGFLVINIPSSNGIIYRVSYMLARLKYTPPLERLWQKGYFSPHLYYYSCRNLTELVEANGFSLVSESRLDVMRVKGLWSRLRHDGGMNVAVVSFIYISILLFYPLLKYLLPSDIMFHIYRKNNF